MSRETRKANLKKLQLPGTSATRNVRQAVVQKPECPVLTKFFKNTPTKLHATNGTTHVMQPHQELVDLPLPAALLITEAPDNEAVSTKPKRAKRTKLNSFLNRDKQDSTRTTEDFEVMEQAVKKAPKKKATTSTKATKNTRTRSKRQPSIKSAFFRNEQIFSEITAQHCLADNFSPDDMQLALAMSKSEAETGGIFCAEDVVEEVVVDVTKKQNANESIRTKLRHYGFRTAPKEDYSTITAAFLPGGLTNRRHKAKWANKFTALTLRDAAAQLRKVNEKAAAFLMKQCITMPLNEEESRPLPFRLVNPALKNLLALEKDRIFSKPEQLNATAPLEQFYVAKLFEVSTVKPGHLFKDWASIPGRDFTPKKLSLQQQKELEIREQRLVQAYRELEEFFIESRCVINIVADVVNETLESPESKTKTTNHESIEAVNQDTFVLAANVSANNENELDAMIELIEEETELNREKVSDIESNQSASDCIDAMNNCEKNHQLSTTNIVIASPFREPPDKKLKLQPVNTEELKNSLKLCNLDERARATSPDIFADSEDEMEVGIPVDVAACTEVDEKCITYEIFSSDEVKMSSRCAKKVSLEEQLKNQNLNNNSCVVVVDLTQEEEEEDEAGTELLNNMSTATTKNIHCIDEDFDIFQSSPPETPPVLTKDTAISEQNFSRRNLPSPSKLLTATSDVSSELQRSKSNLDLFAAQEHNTVQNAAESVHYKHNDDDDDDDVAFVMEMKTDKINTFQDFYDDKQNFSSLSFETALKKDSASFYLQNENNWESFDESAFKLLERKYLGYNTNSEKQNKRKSMSMTQLNDAAGSISKASRKRLSFTQFERKVYEEIEQEEVIRNRSANSPLQAVVDIEFTQGEDSCERIDAVEDDCIILSDDEINYSIWRADKTMHENVDENSPILSQDLTKSSDSEPENVSDKIVDKERVSKYQSPTQQHEFSFEDLWDIKKLSNKKNTIALDFGVDEEPLQSQVLASQIDAYRTPIKTSDFSRERAEFGILDSYSETIGQSPFLTPTKQIQHEVEATPIENSLLSSPSEKSAPMKRYSSTNSSRKFNALLQQVQKDEQMNLDTSDVALDDFDEFDKLVYGSPKARKPTPIASQKRTPIAMQQLLTAELSFRDEPSDKLDYSSPRKLYVSPGKETATPAKKQELCINGRYYSVRISRTPKPDFKVQSDTELLKQLYNFGIKPLKRKQALMMLEFIYNQTHPILLNEGDEEENAITAAQKDKVSVMRVAEDVQPASQIETLQVCQQNTEVDVRDQKEKATVTLVQQKLNLTDCAGDLLLRHQFYLNAELVDAEEYIFQSNVSKKLMQPLLPLHIAWFNLVCSSTALHEAILTFQPIDLQEVFLFFKSIGYRYDPKDLKLFFDRRCIIFRYDLGGPTKPNRHVRKSKKKLGTQK